MVAALLAYESKGLLIGEAADLRVIEGIRRIVGEERRVKRTIDVLTMHMGPDDILLNMSAEFQDELSADEVEDTVAALETRIRGQFPQVRRIFVEADAMRLRRAAGAAPAMPQAGAG